MLSFYLPFTIYIDHSCSVHPAALKTLVLNTATVAERTCGPATPTEIVQINLTKPALIIGIVVAVVTLGGFGLLAVGAGMLATVTQATDPLMALIFMGLVTILSLDILLIRQLSKIVSAALGSDQAENHSQPSRPQPPLNSPRPTQHLLFPHRVSRKTRPLYWKVTIALPSNYRRLKNKRPSCHARTGCERQSSLIEFVAFLA